MMPLVNFRAWLLIASLAAVPALFGQAGGGPAAAVPGKAAAVSAPVAFQSTNYKLGEGDLIDIRVYGVAEFTHSLRIDASGIIDLPLIGQIQAAGKTTSDLETELTARLDGNLIRNPQVSVLITEYRSQRVLVLGAVAQPGEFNLSQDTTLVGVIAMAGGLTSAAQDEVVIQRDSAAGSDSSAPSRKQQITVNMRELLEQGRLSLDVPIYGGDVIRIPERVPQEFYVVGEVLAPGIYQLPREESLLMTHALAQTGGPTKTANAGKGVLIRRQPDGERIQIPVDYVAILKGKKPDLLVQPNDVIYIPGSRFKNITQAMLGIVPGTVSDIPRVLTN
jgi:polysaccharide export outer membrane protein